MWLKCYPLILQEQERSDDMARFDLDVRDMDVLFEAMKNFQGNTEEVINDVLHNEAGELIQDEIQRLMPVSGITWKGKKKAAKQAKSLNIVKENLAVTVKTKDTYHYLWFPDDGQNVRNPNRRKAGNKQFFKKGGESQIDEIVDRCIGRLVNDFEE